MIIKQEFEFFDSFLMLIFAQDNAFDPRLIIATSWVPSLVLGDQLPRAPERSARISTSNRTDGDLILSDAHREELRQHLGHIHSSFRELYAVGATEPFAIEIEFKITSDGDLSIKQARPWVY